MATVILLRHGRTGANADGVLAGRLAGVGLDDRGDAQVAAAASRLAAVPLAAIVSSPLRRCRQTADAVARAHPAGLRVGTDTGLSECDYGEWQGRPLKQLAKERLWRTVQEQPASAVFPGGESMLAMQARAVAAVRRRDAGLGQQHGAGAVWVAVSHGDVIKSVLADALGMHLDLFQRLHVDPGSISLVRYTPARPLVLAVNTTGGDLSWLAPAPRRRGRGRSRPRGRAEEHDAIVGGGAGPEASGTASPRA